MNAISKPPLILPDQPTGLQQADVWEITPPWIEADIPARPWIAEGYMLRGTVTAVIGAGSAGKSSYTCAQAVSLARGQPFGDFAPRDVGYRAMIYNVEDDANEQRRRLSAALKQCGATPDDLRDRLLIMGPSGVGTLMQRDADSGRIEYTPAMEVVVNRIEAFKPDVIFFDPLAELHNVEENDNSAMRHIVAQFRALGVRYNCAVVLVHHTSKAGSASPGDANASRGASAITSAARTVLTLTVMNEEEAAQYGIQKDARTNYFRSDSAKANYSALRGPRWHERIGYVLENGEVVAACRPWIPPQNVVSDADIGGLIEAVALGTPVGPYSPKLSSDQRSVRHLFAQSGIKSAEGQRKALDELLAANVSIRDFIKDNRTAAQGLRAPDGRPAHVRWKD